MIPEDRTCPFGDLCDPQCALYYGGEESARGDCAFIWIHRTLEDIRAILSKLCK